MEEVMGLNGLEKERRQNGFFKSYDRAAGGAIIECAEVIPRFLQVGPGPRSQSLLGKTLKVGPNESKLWTADSKERLPLRAEVKQATKLRYGINPKAVPHPSFGENQGGKEWVHPQIVKSLKKEIYFPEIYLVAKYEFHRILLDFASGFSINEHKSIMESISKLSKKKLNLPVVNCLLSLLHL